MSEKEDDRLDPLSSNFDPLAALYSTSVSLPDPDAPVFDNLTRFKESSSGVEVREVKITKEPKLLLPLEPKEEIPTTSYEFEPDPIREDPKNVLAFMQQVDGPLSCLRHCMETGARIKVTTRHATGVRGYLIAKVLAFDRMWNLALEDVIEVWTRKRKKKSPCLESGERSPDWRVYPPRIKITQVDRKTEKCERRVAKLMMRGEHVVHIQLIE